MKLPGMFDQNPIHTLDKIQQTHSNEKRYQTLTFSPNVKVMAKIERFHPLTIPEVGQQRSRMIRLIIITAVRFLTSENQFQLVILEFGDIGH